ncbi:MAG TPA: hypothetical protein VFC61_04770 [Blastocatellia bacterium]|nr:hypothetical protein [Blastocatellia bacterium]
MRIAKIVSSNSHVDYAARVLDALETPAPPAAADYRFGQFVRVGAAVGVIYNSQLINPEYGNYGPRLSTPPELNTVFSPDYLNEQGVLIGVLLVGSLGEGLREQGVPREVLPINADVETLGDDEVRAFHHDARGALELRYYAHVTTHAGPFAYQLLAAIVDQLEKLTSERERARLQVLRRTLAWQQTVGGMK